MQRWTLFWTFAAVMTAITVWGLLAGAADEDTARLLVRWTIRASVVPFLLAFVAAAAGTLWPGRTAEWLLDNRKHLGLAFAYGVALNMAAIVWLGGFNRGVYWSGLSILDRVESYGGLAVVVALSLTSFDRLSRQISPSIWRLLHTLGMYGLWWVFFRTNWLYSLSAVRRSLLAERWLYLTITTLLIASLLLRLWAIVVRRRSGAPDVLPREPALSH